VDCNNTQTRSSVRLSALATTLIPKLEVLRAHREDKDGRSTTRSDGALIDKMAQLMAEQPGAIERTLSLHCRRGREGRCDWCSSGGYPVSYLARTSTVCPLSRFGLVCTG